VSALAVHPVPGTEGGPPDDAPDQARAVGRKRSTPYLLLLPAALWLIVFFAVPLVFLISQSLQTGSLTTGYAVTWNFGIYPEAVARYAEQIIRSLLYAGAATVLALLIAYPLAYAIAFRAGRFKILLLFAVIAPFFTTYLIRTIAWKTILSDSSPIVSVLQTLALIPEDGRVLATSGAVIAGLTYNFLPFMILPLYANLERLDMRLVEAAKDLYSSSRTAFLKVTLPLTMPGIVAGVLLTFIPAFGDYINAQLLGGTGQAMVGNVIQALYLTQRDYPEAAALSFLMMGLILAIVLIYIRFAGTGAFIGDEDERT
jgi:spermidine/putrescine transport system permease protein